MGFLSPKPANLHLTLPYCAYGCNFLVFLNYYLGTSYCVWLFWSLTSFKLFQFWIQCKVNVEKILFYRATNTQRSRIIIEESLNAPSCFLTVFTYPASQQTLWRWPGSCVPGPTAWRCGSPACQHAGLSPRATAPAARTGSWTGACPAGTASQCRSNQIHRGATPLPPPPPQSCCHPSTDWWSAPSGGVSSHRVGKWGEDDHFIDAGNELVERWIRRYLEEVVDISQVLWRHGNIRSHHSQLHRHTEGGF